MLNKVKLTAVVGVVMTAIGLFFPDLPFPEGVDAFSAGVVVVILTVAQWFVPETEKTVSSLKKLD